MPRALLALCVAVAAPLLFADTVRTLDGRELSGEVSEDGDHVVVKMKFGSVRIKKSEVKEIVREGGATVSGPVPCRVLGCIVAPPAGYRAQRPPAIPLAEAVFHHPEEGIRIDLSLAWLDGPPKYLADDQANRAAEEARIEFSFYASEPVVKKVEIAKVGAFTCAHALLEGKLDGRTPWAVESYVFAVNGRGAALTASAPLGRHTRMHADLLEVLSKLEVFDPAAPPEGVGEVSGLRTPEGIERARQAVRLRREGDSARAQGDARGAVELYNQAIAAWPDHAVAFHHRAWGWAMIEDWSHALEDMQAASKLAPLDEGIRYDLALARMSIAGQTLDEARIKEASPEAAFVEKYGKDVPYLRGFVGKYYFRIGEHWAEERKWAEARRCLKKAIEYYHGEEDPKKSYSRVVTAEAIELANAGKVRKAKELLLEAIKYDPTNQEARDAQAQIEAMESQPEPEPEEEGDE